MNHWLVLLGFLVLVIGGGLAIGYLTAPGEWYAGLDKPSFNPPGWVFAPVWTVLYVLIAVAGWRTFERDRRGWPMRLWWAQLALNFLWSPVFFAAHRIGLALAIILLMLAAILAFHRHGVAAGSGRGMAVRALRRLGGFRLGAQWGDLRIELRWCGIMSDDGDTLMALCGRLEGGLGTADQTYSRLLEVLLAELVLAKERELAAAE